MTLLDSQNKQCGRNSESIYLNQIKCVVDDIVNMRLDQIDNDVKNNLSHERLIDFIFSNFIFSLKKEEDDLNSLLFLLKKVLKDK